MTTIILNGIPIINLQRKSRSMPENKLMLPNSLIRDKPPLLPSDTNNNETPTNDVFGNAESNEDDVLNKKVSEKKSHGNGKSRRNYR